MIRVVVFLSLALAACAAPVTPREGGPTGIVLPQTAEQCAAQPELAWCHGRR